MNLVALLGAPGHIPIFPYHSPLLSSLLDHSFHAALAPVRKDLNSVKEILPSPSLSTFANAASASAMVVKPVPHTTAQAMSS
mmetsp:Transcript_36684/g.67903  ORF Transcript_36684/g.67903 Transcript_36684/m.67903 type:complete len:82 (-) Transcript_36684:488-733(-)